jgi:hypothetical protein
MPDYFIFGGCLRSELSFPELTRISDRTPDWILRIGALSRTDDANVLSDIELSSSCRIRVTRGKGWLRYAHSCTGSFEISAAGRRILFEPSDKGDLDGARSDFVSRVLLYCVGDGSVTWLHGSAVRIGDGAVAFLGASGSGKSTLALALARGGADHICDDTLPVEAGLTPVIRPSDDIIRLCSDSRTRLASSASAIRRESDGKFVLTRRSVGSPHASSASDGRGDARSPLSAIYLLNSAAHFDSDDVVTRRLVTPTSAVPALMRHVKLGPVVGSEHPVRLMRQLGAIASAVPVFELGVSRDWSVVDDVVERVIAWHTHGSVPASHLISA